MPRPTSHSDVWFTTDHTPTVGEVWETINPDGWSPGSGRRSQRVVVALEKIDHSTYVKITKAPIGEERAASVEGLMFQSSARWSIDRFMSAYRRV